MPKVNVQKAPVATPVASLRKIVKPAIQAAKSEDVDGWDFAEKLSCLFYGDPSTGKTTFWSTFPGPTLCLLCSGGRKPGELRSINTPENRLKITARVLTSMDRVKQWIDEATSGKYETIVLDHVTGLLDLALKDVMGVEEIPEQKSWGFTDQATWGQAIGMAKDVCRALLSVDANVVIIGQERVTAPAEDSELGVTKVGVDCSPSLAGWLNYACDYICQTFKRPVMQKVNIAKKSEEPKLVERRVGTKMQYCIRVAPHDVFTTKFRVTKDIALSLPEVVVDPTYQKLLAVIDGHKV